MCGGGGITARTREEVLPPFIAIHLRKITVDGSSGNRGNGWFVRPLMNSFGSFGCNHLSTSPSLQPPSDAVAVFKIVVAVRRCQIPLLESHLNSDQDYANQKSH